MEISINFISFQLWKLPYRSSSHLVSLLAAVREHDGVQHDPRGQADTALLAGHGDVLVGHDRHPLALHLDPLRPPELKPPVWPDEHALVVRAGHHPLHLRLLRLEVVEARGEVKLGVGRGEDDRSCSGVQETDVVHIGDRHSLLTEPHPGGELVLFVCLERHAGVLAYYGEILPGESRYDSVVFVNVAKVGVTEKLENIVSRTELNGLHPLRSYPQDVEDDDGRDEVPEGDQEKGEVDGPEEVGIALLLDYGQFHLGRSCQVCRANWLAVECKASPWRGKSKYKLSISAWQMLAVTQLTIDNQTSGH